MTVTPPENVNYGRVEWQAISDITDGPDSGSRPDFIAPSGTVTFTASTVALRDTSALPNAVSILRDPIIGVLDSEGFLCTPDDDGAPSYRGVELIATDDPDLNPTDWVYNVTYKITGKNGRQIPLQSHQIYVPTDTTVDLTKVGPVENATAIGIPQAEALAAEAQAAALDAQARAAAAEASADAAETFAQQAGTASDANIADKLTNGVQSKAALSAQTEQGLTTPGSVRSAADARVQAVGDGRYGRRGVAEDLVPTVYDSVGTTRVLTPEAATTKFAARGEAMFLIGKGFDPADNSAAAYGVLGTGHAWGWLLDPASNEAITAEFAVPEHWTTITSIEPWWVQTTADSGNVVWRTNIFNLSHNNSLTSGGGSTVTSSASSASTTTARVRVSTIATSLNVDPIKLQRIWLQRFASDSDDTYPADVGVIGIKITGA